MVVRRHGRVDPPQAGFFSKFLVSGENLNATGLEDRQGRFNEAPLHRQPTQAVVASMEPVWA
jgi:hypothetical protein